MCVCPRPATVVSGKDGSQESPKLHRSGAGLSLRSSWEKSRGRCTSDRSPISARLFLESPESGRPERGRDSGKSAENDLLVIEPVEGRMFRLPRWESAVSSSAPGMERRKRKLKKWVAVRESNRPIIRELVLVAVEN